VTSVARDGTLVANALKRSRLFATWPGPAVAELVRMSSIERYAHGQCLHNVGDRVRGLYLVVTGALENSLMQSKGRRYVLGYVPPGDEIGLVPTLDEKAALTDVHAHGDAVVVLVPGMPLRALLNRQPILLFRLTTELCQNIRRFGAHIERLTMLPLRQGVAHARLTHAGSYGHRTSHGIDIELKVSQDDLAAMLSVSRQRANRELRALVAEGIIAARYSHITILDQARLAARVGDQGLLKLLLRVG
jgi:CRP-like cAMP-binding protein